MVFTLARKIRPTEKFRIGIDFASALESGDAAVSHTVTAVDDTGADVTGTILSGAALSGSVSRVTLSSCTNGRTYNVKFKLTTGAGDIFEHSISVACESNA